MVEFAPPEYVPEVLGQFRFNKFIDGYNPNRSLNDEIKLRSRKIEKGRVVERQEPQEVKGLRGPAKKRRKEYLW